MEAMRVEVSGSVGELGTDWDGLADRVGAEPWLRPGWF